MKNFWVTFPPSPKCRKIRVFSDFWATFLLGEEYLSGAKKGARIRGFRKKDQNEPFLLFIDLLK